MNTKSEITETKLRLMALEHEEADAKKAFETVQLELEKNRTQLKELERCLAVSARFSLDSQGLPFPLLPGEEPVIPEGRGVPHE